VGLGTGRVDPTVGFIEPLAPVRRSLNWYSGFITLNMGKMRQAGKARPNDLYMDQFLISGSLADSAPVYDNAETIAPFPWFDVNPIDIPDQPGESVEFARVVLGATVRDPRRPGLEWRYRWNPTVPALLGSFSVLPTSLQSLNYSPAEIGAFARKAMSFFRHHGKGGRPPVDADCQWYLDKADDYAYYHGQTPTKAEFVKFTARPESTMRGHLRDCDLWPWAVFRDQAFPQRHGPSG
jgi:hypothetical protein